MLKKLLELHEQLETNEEPVPVGYKVFGKQSPIRWILNIQSEGDKILAEPTEMQHKPRPIRQRSGKIGPSNLKPYLLADEARYVLGIAEPGKQQETDLVHQAFLDLLKLAWQQTSLDELGTIYQVLTENLDRQSLSKKIEPKDVVTFAVGLPPYPFEKPEVQHFWRRFIEEEFSSGLEGQCSVCGEAQTLIQTLPLEVVIMGQKCQPSSFNLSAFTSFGKGQTTNASLCLRCGMLTAQALDHLLKDPQHKTVLARDDTKGAGNSLRNQVAVYWLKERANVSIAGEEHNLLTLLSVPIAEETEGLEVQATLALLEQFLRIPWSGQESPLRLPSNSFYLAVLSANKGRLVVREWISTSCEVLRLRLARYLGALRLVGPQGEEPRAFPLPVILRPLGNASPNLVRGLLRTVYLGVPPPPGLLEAAVKRLRTPRGRSLEATKKDPAPFHLLAAVLKLALTYGTEEAETMERLDPYRTQPAYLSGRLLAVLEEIQRRAAGGKLNTTLVDRFYGAAATSPASTFGGLLKLAETAHLPKIRKENRGIRQVREVMGEIMSRLDEAGGFPRTLSLLSQGEFALGFYHQRAALAPKKTTNEENQGGAV
jgi:CRISPR-associated protein Csd1